MALFAFVLPCRDPIDRRGSKQQEQGRTQSDIKLQWRHSCSLLLRICLAHICRPIPSKSQTAAVSANAAAEIAPEVGNPNTIATTGAMAPVTTVAAATELNQVAVSLTRSFLTKGMPSPACLLGMTYQASRAD